MTDEKMALLELIEKSADTDLIREMLGFAAGRVMDLEVHACTGAAHGARDPASVGQRYGYRARAWESRAGRIELQIPRLRRGSYFPSFPEPRRTAEKALTAVIQEAYIQGVSTRAVDDLVKAMGGSGIHLVAWIRQESNRIRHLGRLTDSEILSLFSGLAYPCNKVTPFAKLPAVPR